MKLKVLNPAHKNEQPINLSEFYNLKLKCIHIQDPQGEDGKPCEYDIYGADKEQDVKYQSIAAIQNLNKRLTAVEQGAPIPDDNATVISDISIDPARIEILENSLKDMTKKMNNLITIINKLTKKVPI